MVAIASIRKSHPLLGRVVFGEIWNNYVNGNFFVFLINIIRLQCFKTFKRWVLVHGFAVQIVRDGNISPLESKYFFKRKFGLWYLSEAYWRCEKNPPKLNWSDLTGPSNSRKYRLTIKNTDDHPYSLLLIYISLNASFDK